jgi:phage repressor protein C with HTH and peptisase S24 domain
MCHDKLLSSNMVRSSRQFALSLDYLPQSLSEIMKGRRDVTVELLRKSINVYNVNPQYLFTGEGEMFLSEADSANETILTVVTDNNQEEKIVHIPIPAQAGYGGQISDPLFFSELQAYSLPDFDAQRGTFRSFSVSGDSMEPSLFEGDKIVCSFLEKERWINSIKNGYVYVVITQNDVFVKRLFNNIKENGTITLISDNNFYTDKEMEVSEVLEIWYVKIKISPFMPSPSNMRNGFSEEMQNLKDIINQQSGMINNLNTTIEKMLKLNRARI